MRGREGRRAPPTDLLVCFPSRAHLTLMPKPICSPARPSETTKRHHHHHSHQTPLSRSNNRGGQASPLLWAKTKPMDSEISEPTSPKVTCAGQIKVRKKPSSCKNWQSVMEEIERLHNHGKHKKRPSWVETLGFKKEIMQFMTCLRTLRFDLRCFGSFHGSDITSDDELNEEEYEEEEEENQVGVEDSGGSGTSRTVFSKWFMVLQENQTNGLSKEEQFGERRDDRDESCHQGSVMGPSAPPPNALLLMRCRSAPAKGWLEKKAREEEEEAKKTKLASEEAKKKESLVLMSYAPDFFKASRNIAKETWIADGIRDPLSRSRSWKR